MGLSQPGDDRKMEGWLYLILFNRFGLQYSRKRYFLLENNALNCYKSVPTSNTEVPLRRALLDSCIRVTDNGRENVHNNVLFIFTLYNASNHNDQLKLGASSSEEAARWIRALMEATLKECAVKGDNVVSCPKLKWQSFRLSRGRSRMHSINWTAFSSIHSDLITSDVVAPSPWTIFGCNNGLRLFKEAKDGDFDEKYWDDHPAIMAVGVVDAPSEAIFQTVMSLGPSRSEWDFCFSEGNVVEHLDGHNDIIHKKLKSDWLPWSDRYFIFLVVILAVKRTSFSFFFLSSFILVALLCFRGMKRRDLLLRRYWRREDDGTYVVLYHSMLHRKCPPQRSYIRACLKSGGYVISPINQGKMSVVKHMLAIDWRFWRSYLLTTSSKRITIRMLGRIAALRELFRAKIDNHECSEFSSGELALITSMPHAEYEEIKGEVPGVGNSSNGVVIGESIQSPTIAPTLSETLSLSFVSDEFFDVQDESESDQAEALWPPSEEERQPKLSAAAGLVKRLHGLAVQKKGYIDLQEALNGDTIPCSYGTTLRKDATFSIPCSWAETEPSTFLIRSESYLSNRHKEKANGSLMQMVAADWVKSDKREDDLGGRPGSIVQKYANQGGNEFFFIVNIQVPGSTTFSLALYYLMHIPVESVPLLERFVKGDDAFRNSRFKLIPYISKGSWIVKQSVGKKACLIGQALEINYFGGKNYLEVGVDIGSSTVARGVVSLVLGYLTNLVIEMAFLIQGDAEEELPEFLLGTCRLNHLDASRAVSITPWKC